MICSANAQKTEIAAKDALQIESGKDTNILGSTVQGDKVTAKIGGNLHIETLQEKETYEEKNTSAGFNLSWDVSRIKGAQKYSKPTIGASISKGNIFSGRPHFISTSFNPPFEPFFFLRVTHLQSSNGAVLEILLPQGLPKHSLHLLHFSITISERRNRIMTKTATINMRIEPTVKAQAEDVFSSFGISITDAINIFLHASIMEGGFPFQPKQPRYNKETFLAMQEARDIMDGKIEAKRYRSLGALLKDLGEADGDA